MAWSAGWAFCAGIQVGRTCLAGIQSSGGDGFCVWQAFLDGHDGLQPSRAGCAAGQEHGRSPSHVSLRDTAEICHAVWLCPNAEPGGQLTASKSSRCELGRAKAGSSGRRSCCLGSCWVCWGHRIQGGLETSCTHVHLSRRGACLRKGHTCDDILQVTWPASGLSASWPMGGAGPCKSSILGTCMPNISCTARRMLQQCARQGMHRHSTAHEAINAGSLHGGRHGGRQGRWSAWRLHGGNQELQLLLCRKPAGACWPG